MCLKLDSIGRFTIKYRASYIRQIRTKLKLDTSNISHSTILNIEKLLTYKYNYFELFSYNKNENVILILKLTKSKNHKTINKTLNVFCFSNDIFIAIKIKYLYFDLLVSKSTMFF